MVAGFAVVAHRFKPDDWPTLGYEILHSLHGPGFAVLALAILWYLHIKCYSGINYLLAAAITMGIGLLSEIAQIPGARDAQFQDLFVDALAIFGAVGLSASIDKKVRRSLKAWARLSLPVAAGIAIGITCAPTLWYANALLQQDRAFPTLLTFENAWERATFGRTRRGQLDMVPPPTVWPVESTGVARSTEAGRWGIFLSHNPLPDWNDYSRITFVTAAAKGDFVLYFCIRDQKPSRKERSARFCRTFDIDEAPQRITIDFEDIQASIDGRPLNFAKISSIGFSVSNPGGGQAVLLDDIRLEK